MPLLLWNSGYILPTTSRGFLRPKSPTNQPTQNSTLKTQNCRAVSASTKCASFHTSVIRFRVTSHERRATNLPRDHLRKRLQKIRIFSNIFKRFASFFEYFRIFSNVFNRFRTFSKRTCAFDANLIPPSLLSTFSYPLSLPPPTQLNPPYHLRCFQPAALPLSHFCERPCACYLCEL